MAGKVYDRRTLVVDRDPLRQLAVEVGKFPKLTPEDILDAWIKAFEDYGLEAIEAATGVDLTTLKQLLDVFGGDLDLLKSALTALTSGDPAALVAFFQELAELDLLTSLPQILGAFDGINIAGGPGAILALVDPIADNLGKVTDALEGIDLNSPGSVLQAIQTTSESFAQALIAVLGNVPIIGSFVQSLGSQLQAAIRNAVDAIRTATATQQIVGAPPPTPTWQGLTPGFASFPLSQAGSETLTVTATTARLGFITPAQAAEFNGVGMFARQSGTVTGAFLDVYRLDTAAGGLTRIWSSPDLTASITTGSTMAAIQADFPSDLGLVSGLNDVFAVQVRMTGSGSLTIVGRTFPDTAALAGYYPTKPGVVRNPTTAAPDTITPAAMAAIYTNVAPYLMLARYVQAPGGGPVTPPPVLTQYYDGFNRNSTTNSVRLGDDWVSERNKTDFGSGPTLGYLAIREDRVVYGPADDGTVKVGRQGALWRHQAGADSVALEFTLTRPDAARTWAIICAAPDWSNWFGVAIGVDTFEFRTGTSFDPFTVVASQFRDMRLPGQQIGPSTKFLLTYDEDTNTYAVAFADTPTSPILTWVDSTNRVLHGNGRRYAGIVAEQGWSQLCSPVDDFRLSDIVADEEEPIVAPATQIDRYLDFSTLPDGPVNVAGWVPARAGAGASHFRVANGVLIDDNTGTATAANYLTAQLSDAAPIIWGVAGWRWLAAGTANSRFAIVLTTTDFSWDTAPGGYTQFNVGGDAGPFHVVFDEGGYLVQLLDTNAPGGPAPTLANRRYATAIPSGALHAVSFTLNRATDTLTIVGADGHTDPYTTPNFGDLAGNFGYIEIFESNPTTDKKIEILYGGFDSVVGGRTPPASAIASALKPPVAALVGAQANRILAALKPPAGALAGAQTQQGTLAATVKPPADALAAIQPGTIAATLKPATATLAGSQSSGAHVSDNFNRADGPIGSNWTNHMPVLMRVLSNIATPSATDWAVAEHNTPMNTAKHYAEITINTASGSDAYMIFVGSKPAAQCIAYIQAGVAVALYTKTTAYSTLTGLNAAATASSSTVANGDVFRLEFDNGVATLKRNGSALAGVTGINVSAVTGTDGRSVLMAATAVSSARGIDAFDAADF